MKKQSQNSLLDFIPMAFVNRSSDLSPIEASTLYSMWKKNETSHTLEVPSEADSLVVASLITKGFLKPSSSKFGLNSKQVVSVTSLGKEIIKKLVLNEKSVFEKKSSQELIKTASKVIKPVNWLSRFL